MKRSAILFSALAVLVSVSASAEEKTYPSPQEGAPGVYKQLFDNERVRVSEITFNPGDKAPMHTHSMPHVVYIVEGGELTLTYPDGKTTVATAQAGQVLWFPAETHEAVNTGTTVVRGTVTELK